MTAAEKSPLEQEAAFWENAVELLYVLSKSSCGPDLMRRMGYEPTLSELWKVTGREASFKFELFRHVLDCQECYKHMDHLRGWRRLCLIR